MKHAEHLILKDPTASMHLCTCQYWQTLDPNWNSGELFHTSVDVCACFRANYLYIFLIRGHNQLLPLQTAGSTSMVPS